MADEKSTDKMISEDSASQTFETTVEVSIKDESGNASKYSGPGQYKAYKTLDAAVKDLNTDTDNVALQYLNAYVKNLSLQAARNALHVAHGTRSGKAKFEVSDLIKGMMERFGCDEATARAILAGAKK